MKQDKELALLKKHLTELPTGMPEKGNWAFLIKWLLSKLIFVHMHKKKRKGTYLTATEQDFKMCKLEKHIHLNRVVEYNVS